MGVRWWVSPLWWSLRGLEGGCDEQLKWVACFPGVFCLSALGAVVALTLGDVALAVALGCNMYCIAFVSAASWQGCDVNESR